MDVIKQQMLEADGWRVGDADDFLELSPEDSLLVEMKLALSRRLKEYQSLPIPQNELASRVSLSQLQGMENGDSSVSFEFLLRTMLATGVR